VSGLAPWRGAVITGASSGIGRATALLLAEHGLGLVLTGRSLASLEPVAAECRAAGAEVSVLEADVRDADAVRRVLAEAADRYGSGLVVVHSAAVIGYGPFEEVPGEVMTAVIDTNVAGSVEVARAALGEFRRTGGGHLVVVGSLLGQVAAPLMSSYVLSKWAVHGLVRTLQIEARQRAGVEVSLVTPGGVDTPIYRSAASVLGRHGRPPPPVRRPEDVAQRIVRVLRRPRRLTHVGVLNPLVVIGFRLLPGVFDVLVTPLLRTFALAPWQGLPPTTGNVLEPRPIDEEPPMATPATTNLRPRVSRSVAAPAEAVWEVLADGWQYATWVVGASRVRAVDEGWPQPPARIHHSFGLWPAVISDTTVSEEAERPHHLVLTARGWPLGEARVELEIVPDGADTCTVTITEDATKGPGRLVPMPVRQAMILPRNREALRRLALLAEGRYREAHGAAGD
jgi:short-subunit dehydrogenase/uncharacterized protein YndB with AHSA1/START domain